MPLMTTDDIASSLNIKYAHARALLLASGLFIEQPGIRHSHYLPTADAVRSGLAVRRGMRNPDGSRYTRDALTAAGIEALNTHLAKHGLPPAPVVLDTGSLTSKAAEQIVEVLRHMPRGVDVVSMRAVRKLGAIAGSSATLKVALRRVDVAALGWCKEAHGLRRVGSTGDRRLAMG